ncbi:hypothetical protein AB9Q10_27395 [Streptomyces krungchingensis]|uniref:hypothetical protein n=1 Tax=Streptomyces krungchingensis TaxID=1565034 RepID=UPI003CE91215
MGLPLQFGGELMPQHGGLVRGWLDLPGDDVEKLADALRNWEDDEQGRGVMVTTAPTDQQTTSGDSR